MRYLAFLRIKRSAKLQLELIGHPSFAVACQVFAGTIFFAQFCMGYTGMRLTFIRLMIVFGKFPEVNIVVYLSLSLPYSLLYPNYMSCFKVQ